MPRELLEQARTGDALTVRLNGTWRIENIVAIEAALAQLSQEGTRRLVVDTRSLESLDRSGAWLLRERLQALQGEGGRIEFAGEPPSQFAFLEEITAQQTEQAPAEPEPSRSLRDAVAWVGRTSVQQWHQFVEAVGYLGRIISVRASV
jgi:anti-anti-sigma regulatory factor